MKAQLKPRETPGLLFDVYDELWLMIGTKKELYQERFDVA